MNFHIDPSHSDAPNPVDAPGTAREADTVTLAEFARRRAARARRIDATLPEAMPEDWCWWNGRHQPKAKRGRKGRGR